MKDNAILPINACSIDAIVEELERNIKMSNKSSLHDFDVFYYKQNKIHNWKMTSDLHFSNDEIARESSCLFRRLLCTPFSSHFAKLVFGFDSLSPSILSYSLGTSTLLGHWCVFILLVSSKLSPILTTINNLLLFLIQQLPTPFIRYEMLLEILKILSSLACDSNDQKPGQKTYLHSGQAAQREASIVETITSKWIPCKEGKHFCWLVDMVRLPQGTVRNTKMSVIKASI